jgi:hypothetical protein
MSHCSARVVQCGICTQVLQDSDPDHSERIGGVRDDGVVRLEPVCETTKVLDSVVVGTKSN